MAIASVTVTINGTTTTLSKDHDDPTLFRGTLSAPNKTSYNINSEHYYPVTVIATNEAGTSTTVNDTHSTLGSALRLYVKESTAPTITITTPTSNQYFGTATPTMKFKLVDESNGSGIAISTLSIKVDSSTYSNTSSGVSVSTITNGYEVSFTPSSGLADGNHTLTVNVKDNDGNVATSASVSFNTDTIAPTLSITVPQNDNMYFAIPNIALQGTVSDASGKVPTVTATLNGADIGTITVSNGSFQKNITLVSGRNTLVVTATDSVGKVTTITRYVYLDTSTPIIANVSITPNPVGVGQSYTVLINVSEV